jgi:hypothetical protein
VIAARCVAVAVACVLGGCKGSPAPAGGPTDASPVEASTSDAGAHEAGAAPVIDAAATAPPDDLIPPTSSDELTQRARHLLEAVAKDDPDLATDIVFPRDGWLATRDAADAGKDWDKHVSGPFRKSVHARARKHEALQGAHYVSFELGHAIVQATPRRHGFKKPLWTVHGSRLTYVVEGHTRVLPIREMTAWRGAWYVTRLR